MKQPRRVAIIAGSRVPFTKSFSHYAKYTNKDMLTAVLKDLVGKMNLTGQKIGEVSLGAVIKHAYDWNMAREVTLNSGLSPLTPAFDIQKACGTSLETTVAIANKIALGQIDVGIAGGSDTNSDAPFEFPKSFAHKLMKASKAKSVGQRFAAFASLGFKDFKPVIPAVVEPRTGLSMGQHCEKMAQEWSISREAQDELACISHQNGAKAYDENFYEDLIVSFSDLDKDAILRPETSKEKLAKLRAVFDKSDKATLTAGNSTALTDGASAVLLASEEYAQQRGWPILAYLQDAQSAAVDFVGGEGLLMAPTYAVSELLTRNSMKLQDFDFYEIHEAFAAQVLCTLKAWEDQAYCQQKLGLSEPLGKIDRSKMNVKGGSLALGHPFGATGARIVPSLAKILSQAGSGKKGLISICTAGGMGVAAIVTT